MTLSLNSQGQSDSLVSREYKPSIGLGWGYFGYYGEVSSRKNAGMLTGQQGFMLELARGISNQLDISLKVSTGKLTGFQNEFNFKSSLFVGETRVVYNFHPLIPHDSKIHPFVGVGFESFEFNPKADLFDADGNEYNFWDDGSIRSLSQDDVDAAQADILTRDYVYETDLREADLDGLGKYPLVSIGIPISAGINFEISDRLRFKLNSTYSISFTDNIDNYSSAGTGDRKGDTRNDNFLFSTLSFHYDFLIPPKEVDESVFEFPDYFVLDDADFDKDGVPNFLDSCAMTPFGVEVDEKGCPFDTDGDGVADYLDHEKYTAEDTEYVDVNGVGIGDSEFEYWYLEYMDSLDIPIEIISRMTGTPKNAAMFRVRLARIDGRIPEHQVDAYLAEDDLIAIPVDYSTNDYVTDRYGDLKSAEMRLDSLLDKGLSESEIVVEYKNKIYTLDEYLSIDEMEAAKDSTEKAEQIAALEGKYVRVLGSTEADASNVDKARFFPDNNTIQFPGKRNSTKYVNGSYDSFTEAENAAKNSSAEFPDVSIKMFKNGKLIEVDADAIKEEEVEEEESTFEEEQLTNVDTTRYTVKVAEFGNDVSADVTNKMLSIPDISSTTTDNPERTIYTSGDFESISEAKERMNELKDMGFEASVVAINDGAVFNKVKDSLVYTPDELKAMKTTKPAKSIEESEIITKETVFRVQLGAYRNSVSKSIFKGVDIIAFPTKQGITKYVTGSFKTYKEAHQEKSRMHDKGFDDAFVVGYKNGKRVHISELVDESEYIPFKSDSTETAPVNTNTSSSIIEDSKKEIDPNVTYNKSLISIRIQVAVIDSKISTGQKSKYLGLREVKYDFNGSTTKVYAGNFNDIDSAVKYQEVLKSKGFIDTFIVAFYNGESIKLNRAIQILDQ